MLLRSPGIGLLTGDSGTGKTAALRHLTQNTNPHQYKIIYQPETDFTRYEVYSQLASLVGVEDSHRCSNLWRHIKEYMLDLVDNKNITPIWILDEAQNLPTRFFRDLPAFLNVAFDTRDIIIIWLVGLPNLRSILSRPAYSSLANRIQTKTQWLPIEDKKDFSALIVHAFKSAGCNQTILSDTGISLIYAASQGRIKIAHQILVNALHLAASKSINHLPDDVIESAIDLFQ